VANKRSTVLTPANRSLLSEDFKLGVQFIKSAQLETNVFPRAVKCPLKNCPKKPLDSLFGNAYCAGWPAGMADSQSPNPSQPHSAKSKSTDGQCL